MLRVFPKSWAWRSLLLAFGAVLWASDGLGAPESESPPGWESIQSLLQTHCSDCHGAKKQKGGLRLDSLSHLLLGGASGPILDPTNVKQSALVQRLQHPDPEERMPPDGSSKWTSSMKDQVVEWFGEHHKELMDRENREDSPFDSEVYTHWSLLPLERPQVPHGLKADLSDWARNPIDAFVLKAMLGQGLSPSQRAGRETLIRRVCVDMLGLLPSPEEVQTFLQDTHPMAYERLVDRMLASPAYGERWARHWLDVVHYADTHGYDKDKLRPHAWPYRDYVVRSFNADKPYARFVREQLAGDVLYPQSVDGLTATGFIATGPWDFIGHAEVSEDKVDGQIARHLDRDDMVTTAMNTFVSTTVQCARCHHHKFDPVRMDDYYSLQAVFAALDRSDREFDADPVVARQRQFLQERQTQLTADLSALQERIRQKAGEPLREVEASIQTLEKASASRPDAYGYHSAIADVPDVEKWVQVDLGSVQRIQQVRLWGCEDDFNGIGAGFGFPPRFRIEASNEATFTQEKYSLVDHTQQDVTSPGSGVFERTFEPVQARYVRVTATQLAHRSNDFIFALAELEVLDVGGNPLALGAPVQALDSIEAPVRWARSNLVDGKHVESPSLSEDGRNLGELKEARRELLEKATQPEWSRDQHDWKEELKEVAVALEELPPVSKVYAGMVHHGSGAFRGRGHLNGEPRMIRVLARGDVSQPGKEVQPGAIPVFDGQAPSFILADGHSEGDRRVALASWILRRDHPLTWRTIVNRLWQYHFGVGICPTPNDFGRMGADPSHPDLLDWLAVEFRDGGQSFKKLHRLILTSATYRQVSSADPGKASIDGDNRYLWRMNRRRLEAEAYRDSVLQLAGLLDRRMGGTSFRDFVIEKPEHSPHYEYHLHDPMDPQSHRRSVYRFIVRSQQQPFMTTLDCADPSLMVAKRNETLTPAQSLAMLNNPFMLAMSEAWADRLTREGGSLEDQVRGALGTLLGRQPSPMEIHRWLGYARDHGLANTCRWLFNLNAFLFVD